MGFEIFPIDEGVFQIADGVGDCATLLLGEERALLFDTMIGVGNLKGFVGSRTALPLTVVNSHAHLDHMGGNLPFPEVYLHPADLALIGRNREVVAERGRNSGLDLSRCAESLSHTENLRPLDPARCFDLGGLHAQVVPLPGHTPGSVGLLLPERRLLLSGDACTPQMCLFMDGASLSAYRETLTRLRALPFDRFVFGHYTKPFAKNWLDRFAACAELVGRKKGTDYFYSYIPSYTGTAYFLEPWNREAEGPVCIIVGKGQENGE